jgi:hypothetical protein
MGSVDARSFIPLEARPLQVIADLSISACDEAFLAKRQPGLLRQPEIRMFRGKKTYLVGILYSEDKLALRSFRE